MEHRHQFRFLRVLKARPSPSQLELSEWAGGPEADWFMGELEEMMLERMQALAGSTNNDTSAQQGVIRGLDLAVRTIEDMTGRSRGKRTATE